MDSDGYTSKVAKPGREHNPLIRQVVWQTQFKNVLIVAKEDAAPPNDHPAAIDPEDLESLLKKLQVINRDKDKFTLFTPEEAAALAPHLAKALAIVKADEDVVFYYPHRRGLVLIDEALMNSARVFVKDNKINFVFGSLQQSFEGQWIKAGVLKTFPPGSRANSVESNYKLLANTKLGVEVDGARGDWIRVNRSFASETTQTGMKTIQPVPPAQNVEQRLQKLKELRDKGLIDEQQFNEKRKQILEAL